MRGLALDQSLKSTGYALWDEGEPLVSGAWPLSDGIATRANAFLAIHRKIAAFHKEKPIDWLVYETPELMRKDKVDKLIGLYGLVAHIESICKIKLIAVSPVRSRKWRTCFFDHDYNGAGTEKFKAMAIHRAKEFGFDPEVDDEAEAIGIMDWALHDRGFTPQWRIDNPFPASPC